MDDESVTDETEDERSQVYRQGNNTDDPLIVHNPFATGAAWRIALPRLVAGPRDIRRHLGHVIATYKVYSTNAIGEIKFYDPKYLCLNALHSVLLFKYYLPKTVGGVNLY